MIYIIKELELFGYLLICINKGGVMVFLKGKNDIKYCMIIVYFDIFGVMVRVIKLDGWLKIDFIGGYIYNVIEGENCIIYFLKNGKEIFGIVFIY